MWNVHNDGYFIYLSGYCKRYKLKIYNKNEVLDKSNNSS